MKKSFVMAMAAVGMAAGARADILLSFAEVTDAGGGEWLYRYEVQLMGGGNLNPADPYYDSGLFQLFDVDGYVPGSVLFSTYGNGTFTIGDADLDGQGDLTDLGAFYDGIYEIFDGETIGEMTFLSTVGTQVGGTYYSYAEQNATPYEVIDGQILVPGGRVPPPGVIPETSTVLSAGMVGLLGAGYLVRRRRAAAQQA